MGSTWVLAAYRTPSAPSTARVAAWRGLHGLGGLFLGPTVCLLPAALADARQPEAIATRVRAAGGSFELLQIEAFADVAETALRGRYNDASNMSDDTTRFQATSANRVSIESNRAVSTLLEQERQVVCGCRSASRDARNLGPDRAPSQ